jgi:eukaryotic-like serine/threonine-protein kinase
MTEPSINRCSQCGLPIPKSDLGDRCPNCLLELALTPLPGEDGARGATPPTFSPLKSRFFADYEILDEIARGGMGVVYRARQFSLDRIVALKLIQSGLLSSPDALLRFEIEVRAIAQLNHPNIVSLYEAGEHDGQHYFSMSLIAGGDLSDQIRASEFRDDPRHAAGLLAKVARALHHAHQRGILHRDLKPSNILLDEHGEPHVSDFGLAKILERDSGLTPTESVVGSPNYMAPEQATGHSHEVTIAADVYSLGAILYQMLTGQPPFHAGTALETMRLAADQEALSPRKLNPRVSADLETICLKCLRKEPRMRYGTAEELATDLELWLKGLPIHARPIGTLGTVWLWARRHPGVAALGLALTLALIGIAVGSSVAAVRVSRAERKAVASLRESLLNQAHLLRLSAEMGQRSEGLRLLREAAAHDGPEEFRDRLRDELLATLALSDMPFVAQPQLHGPPDHTLTVFDSSFEHQAIIVDRATIVIRRTGDGQELRRFSLGELPVKQLEQFSHDGRYLGMRHPDGISVWDTETGERCFATNGANRVFTFAPNQAVLILEEWQCQISFRRLQGGREIRRIVSAPEEQPTRRLGWSALAVSRNGQRLAAVRAQNNVIELYDLTADPAQHLTNLTNSAAIASVAWNPRQSYLAAATSDRRIVLWNPYSGQVRGTLSLPTPARSIAYSHDGTLLGAACEDRVVRLWQSHGRQPIFSSLCDGHRVRFSPDGQRLGPVVRGGTIGWLELARPAEFIEASLAGSTIRECEFSVDGRILGGGWSDLVAFCNATDLKPLERLPVKRPTSFRFDPRGAAIFASDAAGVGQWTMQWPTPNTLQCSPRESILAGAGWSAIAFSAQGNWFAAANVRSNAALLFDRSLTNRIATLAPHPGVDALAISPHARWLATGSSRDRQVKVWDVQTGEEELSIHAGISPRAAFSADGKWLATFGDTFELRAVGSWKPAPAMPFREGQPLLGAATFSHDSRILAVVRDQYAVQLFDLTTFQSLGILCVPEDRTMHALAFSADGGRLAAACSSGRLRIWDLRLIRQRLTEVNLDWELPPILPPLETKTTSLRMDVPP